MASISQLAREGRLAVLDSLTVDTQHLAPAQSHEPQTPVLVIADVVDENLYLASHNRVNIRWLSPATPIRCRWVTSCGARPRRDQTPQGEMFA
jgi:hypothetical protein